jgi:hypothetical protein
MAKLGNTDYKQRKRRASLFAMPESRKKPPAILRRPFSYLIYIVFKRGLRLIAHYYLTYQNILARRSFYHINAPG